MTLANRGSKNVDN